MKTHLKTLRLIIFIGVASWIYVPVQTERILAISPIAAKSHWNFMSAILQVLTERGHYVTVFTPLPEGNRENYTEIDTSKVIEKRGFIKAEDIKKQFSSWTGIMKMINKFNRNGCQAIYENDAMKKIIADSNSFDVVIVDIVTSECGSYLSTLLNIPLVYIIAPPLIPYMERTVLGHYPNPAAVSHLFNDYSVPRTFVERFSNTVLLMYTSCLLNYINWSINEDDVQPFDKVEPTKPSIMFTNGHFITDASRPLPPNVIKIGGIHLKPQKKIPDDILEFIEDWPHGVIFFSLGTVIKGSTLATNVEKMLKEVLGKIPQRVLWKYEDEMKDKPDNVMIRKWMPQRDILLHPNVKLFISHGGISGLYEAVDAGVPVLGFPMIFDQPRNLRNLKDAGMGISLKLESISNDTLLNSILELINNKKYMNNAKIASERFKDRPMSYSDTVDYWVRYVIRHKGAPHLKSHGINLTWYQYFLLDVMAVFLITVLLVVFTVYMVLKLFYKYFVVSFKSKLD